VVNRAKAKLLLCVALASGGLMLACFGSTRPGSLRAQEALGELAHPVPVAQYLAPLANCVADGERLALDTESREQSFLLGAGLAAHGVQVAPVFDEREDFAVDGAIAGEPEDLQGEGPPPLRSVAMRDGRLMVRDRDHPAALGCAFSLPSGYELRSELDLLGVLEDISQHLEATSPQDEPHQVGVSVMYGGWRLDGDTLGPLLQSPALRRASGPQPPLEERWQQSQPSLQSRAARYTFRNDGRVPLLAHVELALDPAGSGRLIARGRLYDTSGQRPWVLHHTPVQVLANGPPRVLESQLLEPEHCRRPRFFEAFEEDCRAAGFQGIEAWMTQRDFGHPMWLRLGDAEQVALAGRYHVVAFQEGGLAVLDSSDPANPLLVDILDIPSDGVEALAAHRNQVFIALTSGGVYHYRLDADGRLGEPHVFGRELGFQHLLLDGDLLYGSIAGRRGPRESTSPRLLTYRLTEEDHPELTSDQAFPYGVAEMRRFDDQLYLALGDDGFAVFDLEEPASPRLLLHHAKPTSGRITYSVRDLVLRGDRLYAANGGEEPELLEFRLDTAGWEVLAERGYESASFGRWWRFGLVGKRVLVSGDPGGLGQLELRGDAPPRLRTVAPTWNPAGTAAVPGHRHHVLATLEHNGAVWLRLDDEGPVEELEPIPDGDAHGVAVAPLGQDGGVPTQLVGCQAPTSACVQMEPIPPVHFEPLPTFDRDLIYAEDCRTGVGLSCALWAEKVARDAGVYLKNGELLSRFIGKDVDRDAGRQKVLGLLGRACEQGYWPSCVQLAGWQGEDRTCALGLWQQACLLGDAQSCFRLHQPDTAPLYHLGTTARHNSNRARTRWDELGFMDRCRRAGVQRSCHLGDAASCDLMESVLLAPEPDADELSAGLSLLQGRCAAGWSSSCWYLGLQAEREGQEALALEGFQGACEKGHAVACVAAELMGEGKVDVLRTQCQERVEGDLWPRRNSTQWYLPPVKKSGCASLGLAYARGELTAHAPAKAATLVQTLETLCERQAGETDAARTLPCALAGTLLLEGAGSPEGAGPPEGVESAESHQARALALLKRGGLDISAEAPHEALYDAMRARNSFFRHVAKDVFPGERQRHLYRCCEEDLNCQCCDILAKRLAEGYAGAPNAEEAQRIRAVMVEVGRQDPVEGHRNHPASRTCSRERKQATLDLALGHLRGDGTAQDASRARQLIEPLCEELEHREACYWLGTLDLPNSDGGGSLPKAMARLDERCGPSVGHRSAACTQLARLHLSGTVEEPDTERAAALLIQACRYGTMAACEDLAALYEEGQVVPANSELAEALRQLARDRSQGRDPFGLE
jgi:TPR repeat protein